jgi:hypothetical protein
LDIVVVILLAGVGGYLWRSPDLRWLGGACMTVAAGFALLLIAAFTVIPRLVFRREPRFRDDHSLTFSPEGIQFRTAHIDSRLQWSVYARALIAGHSYVLYHGPRAFTVIPKRLFQSQEQRQAFEQLLAEHIPRIVTKTR